MMLNKNYIHVKGWYDYEMLYDAMVQAVDKGAHFVEVGCYLGKAVIHLAYLSDKYGKDLKIDAIDIWADFDDAPPEITEAFAKGDPDILYNQFIENLEKCGVRDKITPHRIPSVEASEMYKDNSIDIVFIDANHTYPEVMRDLIAWHPKAKYIIAGDDYNWTGVAEAVNEFYGEDRRLHRRSKWIHFKDKSWVNKIRV